MEIKILLQIAGGLGVFLFGMKLMSESLQLVAGQRLKSLLRIMTTNRFAAVISGLAMTVTVQSSSATTVLVVGFVNASLLNLRQAIGVIMGANIGTTVTAWMISILGFLGDSDDPKAYKFKIAEYALPIIALGVVFLFTRKTKLVNLGNTLVGFGLLFLGLSFLKEAVPDGAKDPEAFKFIAAYSKFTFWNVLIFVFFGTLLTVVLQSSSATSALTITLTVAGFIPYQMAMAMILGENIGTTITANLAALAGNANAKKAALAHTLFNVFGVIWALIVFDYAVDLIPKIIPGDPKTDKQVLGYYISTFHTSFNILNTVFMIGFVPVIERIVNAIASALSLRTQKKNRFQNLSSGTVRSADMAIFEIQEHNRKILLSELENFKKVEDLILKDYSETKMRDIMDDETRLDEYRSDMQSYLHEIQTSGVSGESADKLLSIMERVRSLEEMGDGFARIARKMRRANKNKISIGGKKNRAVIEELLGYLNTHLDLIRIGVEEDMLDSVESATRSKVYREEFKKLFKTAEKNLMKQKKKSGSMNQVLYADLIQLLDLLSRSLNEIILAGSNQD